jgi:hypothetical protein
MARAWSDTRLKWYRRSLSLVGSGERWISTTDLPEQFEMLKRT